MWSVDGHLKFRSYGIEIYAAIDAYSRYIVWIHVGLSAVTGISVAKQYFQTVLEEDVQPQRIRSDRGSETTLVAAGHHLLSEAVLDQYPSQEHPPRFEEAWMYGTSTKNVKIEAWWNQLQRSVLFKWLVRLSICFRSYCLFSRLFCTGSFAKPS